MNLSIVTRSIRTSELYRLLDAIGEFKINEFEVVAVCRIKDCEVDNIRLILEDTNRFEARITGIRNANYENILLLDSDQVPEMGLIDELINIDAQMVIIPERSLSRSLVASWLDDYRKRIENYAHRYPAPNIPVVPRFYKRNILLKAIELLPHRIYESESHEDSILYYKAFDITHDVKFSKRHIYNYDSNFSTIMKKTMLYGKYKRKANNNSLPQEFLKLLRELNINSLNVKEIGLSKGYFFQVFRGIMYYIGSLIG